MLRQVLWWTFILWAIIGVGLVLIYLATEVFGNTARPWRERLRELMIVGPVFLFGWPIVLLIGIIQIRRDVTLERACYGRRQQLAPPITELEWQRGSDSVRLLGGLHHPVSERKRRLFACACCRRIWERISDDRSRNAVELAEKLADGQAAPEQVRVASGQAGAVVSGYLSGGELEAGAAAKACQDCLLGDGLAAAERASVSQYRQRIRERRAQCELLREIVGNPFKPLPARTFAPEVVELARAIHEGDHELFGLLADALDDVGEHEAAEHCRTGKHLRGCHVIDWVLGWR